MTKKLFISISILIFILSCQREGEKNMVQNQLVQENLYFKSFEKYGEIHNDFLTHFKNEFQEEESISGLDERIGFINEFNKSFVHQLDLSEQNKNVLSESLNDFKEFVHTPSFYTKLYYNKNTRSTDNEAEIFKANRMALENNVIDDFEFEKLNLIALNVRENHEGNVSDLELQKLLQQIKDEWLAKKYNTDSAHGKTLAITLAISLASLDWWHKNPDAHGMRTRAVPAWVGADIAGAVYSSVVAGVGSYTTTGEINWGAVGIAAGGGAIAGSTGIIGKAGKWLSGLF